MKRFNSVLTILLIFTLTHLAGCQNSPGGIFSPSAELFVAKVAPPFLQPELSDESSGSSSSGEKTIVLPALALSFNVSNGVSCFLSSYVIRYYNTSGTSLNDGKFDHSGAMSLFVDAPAITWNTSEEEEEVVGTTGSGKNQTAIEVFLPSVYAHMTKGNAVITDDITPVIARIEFSGKDINDKDIKAVAQVNLVTTIKEEESN